MYLICIYVIAIAELGSFSWYVNLKDACAAPRGPVATPLSRWIPRLYVKHLSALFEGHADWQMNRSKENETERGGGRAHIYKCTKFIKRERTCGNFFSRSANVCLLDVDVDVEDESDSTIQRLNDCWNIYIPTPRSSST